MIPLNTFFKSLLRGAPDRSGAITTVSSPRMIQLYGRRAMSFDQLYAESAAVSSVVDFLAGNVANTGLHAFMRVGDGVERLSNRHELESLLRQPNPRTSGHEWRRDLTADVALHGNHYSVKVRNDDGVVAGLVRIPPPKVSVVRLDETEPARYRMRFSSGETDYEASEVFHVRTYSTDGLVGVSPLASLRDVLSEDIEAVRNREAFWRNSARAGAWLERPLDAPPWDDQTRRRFKESFRELNVGEHNAGEVPIIEDGMKLHTDGFSPRDSEYVQSRDQVVRFVAARFGIPPNLIGLGAGDKNIDAFQRALVLNVLSPWFSLIEESINRDLVPDVVGQQAVHDRIYCEFTVEERNRGNFFQNAKALEMAVGGPWLEVNRVRKMFNLPPIDGGDELTPPAPILGRPPAEGF